MTACDFWTSERVDKRILRHKDPEKNEFTKLLTGMTDRLQERGCSWSRSSRINFETHDVIWSEGWLQRPDVEPPFDAAALPEDRKV